MIFGLAARMMWRPRHHTLIFHRVLREIDPMNPGEPTVGWFNGLMSALSANFEMISLSEAVRRAGAGKLTGRTVSVTFDDGYADNFSIAYPVLNELGIPATFFVASAFLDGGRMWNDSIIETVRQLDEGEHEFDLPGNARHRLTGWESRRQVAATLIRNWKHLPPPERLHKVDELASRVQALPTDLMMTSRQLKTLANSPGACIGGHTRSHPILASLSADEARKEIVAGKRDIENFIQRELTLFAYPNGKRDQDYRPEHLDLVKDAGFMAAVSTNWGTLDAATDVYEIPRFTPWHRNLGRFSFDLARCHYGLF